MLLETIEDGGFERGAVGQADRAIIYVVQDKNNILEQISFDPATSEDAWYRALLLLVFHRQLVVRPWCVQVIDRYMTQFLADENENPLESLCPSMVDGGALDLY